MPATICLRSLLLAAFVLFFPDTLFSEVVQHHGLLVEADGDHRECASCHDGAMASNAPYCMNDCGPESPHPLLKHYPPAGQEHLYAPAAVLEARGIKFPGNEVSCISCHNVRKNEKHHLVMDNKGSRLCLACHIKK